MALSKVYIVATKEDDPVLEEKIQKVKHRLEESRKFECFHPLYDTDPNESEPERSQSELKKADRVIIMVTKRFLKDKYAAFQNDMAQMKDSEHLLCNAIIIEDMLPDDIPNHIKINVYEYYVDTKDFFTKLCDSLESRTVRSECIPAGQLYQGLVSSYFYGFLKPVLRDFKGNVEDYRRREKQQIPEGAKLVKKMLILIPESCKCKSLTSYDGDHIRELDGKLECRMDATDTKGRNYDTTMYCVTDPQDPAAKYCVVLMPNATIHGLHEMCMDPQTVLDKITMIEERQKFETLLQAEIERNELDAEVISFKDDNLVSLVVEKCRTLNA